MSPAGETAGFLAGGGAMGALMRAHDWPATPLGPVEAWSPSLRSAIGICLNARFPIAIYWGAELALLYNDDWSPIPGGKHPWALGRPAREVWPEIWDMIGPLFDRVAATGEGTYAEDQLLPMHRRGFTEECYFNFTFSPIQGEDGRVAGIFNAVVETTYRVIDERRTRLLRSLAESAAAARSAEEACLLAAGTMAEARADMPFCLLYLLSPDGREARLAAASGLAAPGPEAIGLEAEGSPWPFARAIRSGRAELVSGLADRLGAVPGPWPEPVGRALVAPVAAAQRPGERPFGFLVAGLSPRLAPDEAYRAFVERAAIHVAGAIANARAYEEERRRAEALAELDRAKTAFFANVSHEFRTPLTLMLGPLEESLAGAARLPPGERGRIELAHRNALRLLRLVNALLDFSRVEAGRAAARYAPTDLAAMTAELASSFRSLCERAGLDLAVECPSLPGPVHVDRDMWEKVVLNLLSNAFKFTLAGGIAVSLRPSADGRAAVLAVRDTGAGIPASELPRIFERFHRIEGARGRSIEGSGIGLALVRELVRLHGGEIAVESTEEKGSAFTVTLPFGTAHLPPDRIGEAAAPAAPVHAGAFVEEAQRWLPDGAASGGALPAGAPPAEAPFPAAAEGTAGRVLLADDNADMRRYLTRLLAGRGYAVEAVADGAAALDAARRRRPDLVLSDMMMPGLDGFALLRALRAEPALAEVPVMLLSARAGEEAQVEGLEAGADDYLTKPFSGRELLARVGANLTLARVRREAAEAIAARSAELEAVLATVPAAVWFTRDPAARAVWGNRRAAGILRLPEGANASLSASAEERPDFRVFRDGVEAAPETLPIQRAARGEEVRGDEQEVRFADGSPPVVLLCHATPLRDGEGRLAGAVCAALDITERRRAVEALRESEERFRTMADSAPALIWMTDAEARLTFANRCFEQMFGRPAGDMLGRGWRRIVHPGDLDGFAAAFREAFAARRPFRAEARVIDHAGRVRWLRCEGVPRASRGAFVGYVGCNVDITAAKLAADALEAEVAARARDRNRIWRLSRDPFLVADAEGRWLDASPAWTDLLGWSQQELLGRTSEWMEHPEDRAGTRAEIGRLAAGGTTLRFENRFRARDGSWRWFSWTAVAEEGLLYATARDVTAERERQAALERSQEALRASEARLRAIIETSFQYHGYLAPDGTLLDTNRASLEGIGATLAEVAGRPFWETPWFAGTPGMPEQVREAVGRVAAGEAVRQEIVLDLPIGRRFFGFSLRPVLGPDGAMTGMVPEAIDITERRQAEEQLRQAQKMEAVGQLTGGVAHDFNNLLTVVTGNLVTLLRHLPEEGEGAGRLRRSAGNALRGAQRAAALTHRLLAFSRRQPLDPKPLDVNREVAGMSELLRRTLGETVAIETVLAGGLWRVEADPNQLESALLNLAVNARHAMPGGGRMTIETANAHLDEAYAAAHAEVLPGQYVAICVTDTGTGMPREVLDRAFEPFFTTKEVGQGTGLGLSQVYGFAKQSGGHVKIYSEPGEGTTVKLYLPRLPGPRLPGAVAGAAEEEAAGAAPPVPEGRRGETILVVEDDPDVRAYSVESLRELGYRVIEAPDGAAALALLDRHPRLDLLFTDVVLPNGMTGRQLADAVRARRPRLRVLFTTGYARNAIVHQGRLDPGVVLLPKPFTYAELAARVRDVLDGGEAPPGS